MRIFIDVLSYVSVILGSVAAIALFIVYFSMKDKEKKARKDLEERVSNDCLMILRTPDGRIGNYFCEHYEKYPNCSVCKECLADRSEKVAHVEFEE